MAELEDSESDWSGAKDGHERPSKASRSARQMRPGAKPLAKPRRIAQPRLKRLIKHQPGSDASGASLNI